MSEMPWWGYALSIIVLLIGISPVVLFVGALWLVGREGREIESRPWEGD